MRVPVRRGEIRVHSDVQAGRPSAWESVWKLVRRIPRGRVMTYGQISTELESTLSARAVGWALHRCPEDVPWQRVVNASGGCSTRRLTLPTDLQQVLLEAEGVRFGEDGTLDLARYRWVPRARPARSSSRARRAGS